MHQLINFMSDDLQTIGLKQIGRLIHPDEGVRLGEDFFLIDVSEGKNLEFMNYPFRSDAYFLVYCVRGGIDVEATGLVGKQNLRVRMELGKNGIAAHAVLFLLSGNGGGEQQGCEEKKFFHYELI